MVSKVLESKNSVSSTGQNQPGGSADGGDIFSATQPSQKGGMRGIGLVSAILADIAVKEKVLGIAKDYYKTNKKDYDFYSTNHKGPLQDSVTEAFGPNNPDYDTDLYAGSPGAMAKAAIIDRQWFEARRRLPKYNIGQRRRLDYEMALAKTNANVAGWVLGYTYELNWADERNVRAFRRKTDITNIGMGFGAVVRQGMARAVDRLSSAYDNLGDTIASVANGYAGRAGYNAGREYGTQQYGMNRLPTTMQVSNIRGNKIGQPK